MRILVVEDDPKAARFVKQGLEEEGHVVDVARDGEEGAHYGHLNPYDLIILDINLPGMDGYEVLSVLKNDSFTSGIPVIGLSANAMPYDIERGRSAGFFDYLTKPVDINQLINVFNKLLRD